MKRSTALLLLGGAGLLVAAGAANGSGADRARARANDEGAAPLPSWVPPGTTLAMAGSPLQPQQTTAIGRGSWYWDNDRNMPAGTWTLLTRTAAPTAAARRILVRAWLRITSAAAKVDGKVRFADAPTGGIYDVTGDLTTPLVIGGQQTSARSLVAGKVPWPFVFRLTRHGNGEISIEAKNSAPIAQQVGCALEFTFT